MSFFKIPSYFAIPSRNEDQQMPLEFYLLRLLRQVENDWKILPAFSEDVAGILESIVVDHHHLVTTGQHFLIVSIDSE